MRLDESFLDKGGELAFELGMSHERYLDGYVDWWWSVVLVGHGIFELVECHGPVWFLNVLCKSPKKEQVMNVVLHAPEGPESKVRLLGLGG